MEKQIITVETTVPAPIEKVWQCWTEPEHITGWAFADDSWHAPSATNDVRVDGRFNTRMEAKDGSAGFDFSGTYTEVTPLSHMTYTMDGADARKVSVDFISEGDSTKIVETFEAENENPIEMQRGGWQSILENFAKHVASH
jgi:uncharacterized protein YndB with AHSA1/START domain